MIKFKRFCLNRKKMMELFNNSKSFSSFNTSFYKYYLTKVPILRFILFLDIRFIYDNKDLIGYMWFNKIYERTYSIKDLVIDSKFQETKTKANITFLRRGLFVYECEDNNFNNITLDTLGFRKTGQTLLMRKDVGEESSLELPNDISFSFLRHNMDENIRCDLQNNIFEDDSRIPLTIDDIYYDQSQDYYLQDASVFIKYRDEYVGYGQIILNNNDFYIVNLGIVSNYRGMGYSTYLLKYLINLAFRRNMKKIYIRVDEKNEIAKKLYYSNGFIFLDKINVWEQ